MEQRIDRRRNYGIVFDTETANTGRDEETGQLFIKDGLFYDFGFSVVDTKGNVYEEFSFINRDIFFEKELMNSAYYKKKIPMYWVGIKNGTRRLASTYEIHKTIMEMIEKYEIKWMCAHNAYFDYTVTNATQRWVSKSKYRYFIPYDVEIWDTMKMARDTICKMPTYKKFSEKHGMLTANGRPSASAENLYRFITKNPNFVESHTGLEDVQIEREILWYCLRQHKKMRKKLWERA